MPSTIVRDCEIFYDVLGDPGTSTEVPFVWGHGLTSSRADEDVLPLVACGALAARRPVLRYDARGHGASGDLTSPQQGDWAQLALDQIALIDHLGWGDVVIGGASMGTATALHAATALGSRVRGLVLVIPPTAWETRSTQVDLYEQMAAAVERSGTESLEAGMRDMPPPDPFTLDGDWLERRITTLRAARPDRLAAAFRGAGTADLPSRERVAALDVPALILAWSGDDGHPVSTAEQLGDLLPNADVVIASTREDFDSWTDRVDDFLDRSIDG